MVINRSYLLALGLCLTGVAAGCGGSSKDDATGGGNQAEGSPAGMLDSGVDKSKPANTLTEAEHLQLCETTADYFFATFGPELCRLEGVAAGSVALFTGEDVQATCEQGIVDCGANLAMDTIALECNYEEGTITQCSSSVAEIEACFQAAFDYGTSLFRSVNFPPCAQLEAWIEGGGAEASAMVEIDEDFDIYDIPECAQLAPGCIETESSGF